MIDFVKWVRHSKDDFKDELGHRWRLAHCRETLCGRIFEFKEYRCSVCGWRRPDILEKPLCNEVVVGKIMGS